MKMLKKLICLALALTMLLTACAFAEVGKSYPFDPISANAVGASMKEWYSYKYNRALLSVLLLLDCDRILAEDGLLDTTNCFRETAYVGTTDGVLVAFYHCTNGDLLISYDADAGTAYYTVMNDMVDLKASAFMFGLCDGNYYFCDPIIVIADIMEIVASN